MLMKSNTRSHSHAIDRLTSAAGWTRALLPQGGLRRLYESSQQARGTNVFEALIRGLEVSYAVSEKDIGFIPKAGAAIVVANHPFGMLDGLLLGALLLRIRGDIKLLANKMLAAIPEMAAHCIYVDAMSGDDSLVVNARGLRHAVRHLRNEGLIVVFPAGEVAHWSPRTLSVSEPPWDDSTARLSQLTGAPVVPICIHGANSFAFHASGLIHPKLRTLQLPRELLNKRGHRVEISIGSPIKAERLRELGETATSMLRWNTDALSVRVIPSRSRWFPHLSRPAKPIAEETDRDLVERELRSLPPEARLQEQGEFDVYAVSTAQAPNVVREIGRLREISFRQAGEGTGHSLDLDRFDEYYTQLVLWQRERREIAGGYRLGSVDRILERFGPGGLYTSTLFRYQPSFFPCTGSALELGRSFVRPEYQKHYMPLLQLWKGVGAYLVRHPETPVLFGAVSVSNVYSRPSRELIAAFLHARMAPEELVNKVSSRALFHRPPRCTRSREQSFTRVLTLAEVSERVAGWEVDGKDLPILVKHYLKLGGRSLAFAVDPKFSDVLDCLIMIDLRASDSVLLSKYMGKSGAQIFLGARRAAS
jgi:putative hemolysin